MQSLLFSLIILWLQCHPLLCTVSCPNSPDTYTDGGDGSCYTSIIDNRNRDESGYHCAIYKSYLNDVNNAFDNTRVQQLGSSLDSNAGIWLGLTCLTNDPKTCMWDATGENVTVGSYTNFYGGSPNITLGPCVYMKIINGMWYSGDCFADKHYFGCKYTPSITAPLCEFTNSKFNLYRSGTNNFRNKCYWLNGEADFATAYSYCTQNCGAVTSIHSPGENAYISSLETERSQFHNFTYVYIGLQYKNGIYTWDDGSPYDYNNFGYENTLLGNCVSMALNTVKFVSSGKWVNTDCAQHLPLVCERDWQQSCPRSSSLEKKELMNQNAFDPGVQNQPFSAFGSNVQCSSKFANGGDGSCYSNFYPAVSRNTAAKNCANEGAFLYEANDSLLNIFIAAQSEATDSLWLGLTCTSNKITSCVWDSTGKSLTSNSFSNFHGGLPNITQGSCVYMKAKTGIWHSADCKGSKNNYGCKYTPAGLQTIDLHPTNSSNQCSSTQFYTQNGTIYSPGYPNGTDANDCDYVITVNGNKTAQIYFTVLKLQRNSTLSFYSKINQITPFITLNSNSTMKTITSPSNLIVIRYHTTGDGSHWIGHFTPAALYKQCPPIPWQLYNSGTLACPNYPGAPIPNSCGYVIIEMSNQTAQIHFTSLILGAGSSLTFYSDEFSNDSLFKTITMQNQEYSMTIISPTNVLRMYFNTTGDYSLWAGNYGSTPTPLNCDSTSYSSGIISSDNYPSGYSTTLDHNCTYTLNSQRSVTCIVFDDLDIEDGDYLQVFDGSPSNKLLATYTNINKFPTSPICTQEHVEMNVVFVVHSYPGFPGRGFKARFDSSGQNLMPKGANETFTFLIVFFSTFCTFLK